MADESGEARQANLARERIEFSHFLAWLAPDCEYGAKQYELLHQKLIMFFDCRRRQCQQNLRGALCPADLCDRAIQRAVGKVAEGVDVPPGKRVAYVLGIARYIWKEWLNERPELPTDPDAVTRIVDWKRAGDPPDGHEAEQESRLDTLDACLHELPTKERELILKWYAPGNRNANHEAIRVTMNTTKVAIRLRIKRIKDKLRECVRQRMAAETRG